MIGMFVVQNMEENVKRKKKRQCVSMLFYNVYKGYKWNWHVYDNDTKQAFLMDIWHDMIVPSKRR